ncbi:MAG: asparagine synthase (glutamine-hydrolyzing) [Alphaproteobacteria bacterium]|nr:asparagine synthase (glutamine-hydrolyzing) [Alphaproteobacteria bacterium]MBV9372938.1 asparagine synthase (glutamine-hydrolyzing) [Alphaproteobacteria bacterium]MBV9900943.1 asparagine synthase (glutamine-hydrolyzing) [Alphaproteobacteria bacterium]
MCGIAGFIDPSRGQDVLEAMTGAIARRGPDDCGYYLEDGVGLGHRRLSIIDLSPLGHQPMRFERLVTVFNGEIYNYREVAEELVRRGYSFTSSSDTEVVLKAFHCWGPRCVERFIGMFAFALWDEAEKALYLIRDRAGVKPLYYYEKDGRFAFASTLNGLKPFLGADERGDIDPAAVSEFLAHGYISSGLSILSSVAKVPQAHILKFQQGRVTLERYWNVHYAENAEWRERPLDDLVDELEEIVISAFRYRMVADVPVGVFLSAGVDSSLVTAVLSKHYGSLRTFTIGFSEEGYDESADARKIAAYLGTEHKEAVLSSGRGRDILEHFYDIYDEPHGDSSGIATTYVSQLAKENGVKVVLSADAGDELFGGYVRYVEFLNRWEQVRRLGLAGRVGARGAFALAGAVAPGARGETLRRQAGLLADQPFLSFMQRRLHSASAGDLAALFPAYEERLTPPAEGELLNQMGEWDFKRYMVDDVLVKVDRATMYHSIEGREPLLDHRLVEFAAQLPAKFKIAGGETKLILKRLLGRYLPRELYTLPKRGFAAPLDQWIRDYYQDHFLEMLDDPAPFFDRKALERLLARYRRGERVNYGLLWFLFSFESWRRKWTQAA